MRLRLLVTLSLLALPVAPGHAAARHRAVRHVPGRVTMGEVPRAERLDRALESLAVSPLSRDVLRRVDVAAAEGEHRVTFPAAVRDLDRDRVGDVLLYDTTWAETPDGGETGDTVLTLFSGRDGRQVWRRVAQPFALPSVVPVGAAGHDGVLVQTAWLDAGGDVPCRFVGIGGRGEPVYDVTVSPEDGLGSVRFGGTFDAVPRGGTDLLIARVLRVGGADLRGYHAPGADLTQVFVLDGGAGAYAPVTPRRPGAGGAVTFLAVGDLDGDRRDDYVQVRAGLRDRGTVTARSTVEDRTLWENGDVPVGSANELDGPAADVTGGSSEDVLLSAWMDGAPLLHVAGVTDGLPLVDGGPSGVHGVLLDGAGGTLVWDRVDGELASYRPYADVDHDRKAEVLTTGIVRRDDRAGLRFGLVDGRNRVRAQREVLLPSVVPSLESVGGSVDDAGDVDADGVPDLAYAVGVGTTGPVPRWTSGLLLARTLTVVTTTDVALLGTLDGHGADRNGWTWADRAWRVSFRDGRTGASYWSLSVTTDLPHVGVAALEGGRGRCADVLVLVSGDGDSAGDVWVARVSGADGRTRWSRALSGRPAAPALARPGGRPARCA